MTRGELPTEVRNDVLAWVGCIAGALDEQDYRAKLAAAGFESIEIEPTRVYPESEGKVFAAFVRAAKPGRG